MYKILCNFNLNYLPTLGIAMRIFIHAYICASSKSNFCKINRSILTNVTSARSINNTYRWKIKNIFKTHRQYIGVYIHIYIYRYNILELQQVTHYTCNYLSN